MANRLIISDLGFHYLCFCHLEKTHFLLDRDNTVYGSRGCVEPSKSAAQPLLMPSVLERASDPLR